MYTYDFQTKVVQSKVWLLLNSVSSSGHIPLQADMMLLASLDEVKVILLKDLIYIIHIDQKAFLIEIIKNHFKLISAREILYTSIYLHKKTKTYV